MTPDTRALILREAEFLIRTRGYAAFSYADLSERVAITKASIHYYFPTKEELIQVLVREYVARFIATLERIKRQYAGPSERLRAYAHLFLDGFEKGMLPLCGALSAERSALPETMRPQVEAFFQIHIDWLVGVLGEGLTAGALRPGVAPQQVALLLLSTLEGGTFVGWALQQKAPVLAAFETALRSIETTNREPNEGRMIALTD
jgi:TetR/AcrR family transcriptional regulator, transcriptional repressor for nem operon